MKRTVGISFTTTNLIYYWSWFKEEDLQNVELLELSFEKNNVEDFHKCDGFILTGGVDIHPAMYAGAKEYENNPAEFQVERDYFEEKIFSYSQANKRPLLGLCRGLQLVNVLQGGRLIQDLGVGNFVHRSLGVDREHEVIVEKDTLLHRVTGIVSGMVNSVHHQVVDPHAIGDNLRVNAYSYPGKEVIEGLEFDNKTNKAFMMCVQWHPERIKDRQNAFSRKIKSSFLEAVLTRPL